MPMSAQAPMRTGLISRSVVTIGMSTGMPRMRRSEHLGAGPPADEILEHEIARVEIGLRADPDVVADDAGAVEAALDVGLRADEDAVADLEGLEMLEADAAADLQPVPQRRATARKIARRISASTAPSPFAKRP